MFFLIGEPSQFYFQPKLWFLKITRKILALNFGYFLLSCFHPELFGLKVNNGEQRIKQPTDLSGFI
jgi:hypothetical protein